VTCREMPFAAMSYSLIGELTVPPTFEAPSAVLAD
jgi:hypothetical protein